MQTRLVDVAHKESPAARTTVYRLQGVAELSSAIRPKYLSSDDFEETSTVVEGREALLVSGAMRKDRASWAGRLSNLAATDVEVGNTTAAAVLIIRNDTDAYALTYGMGFQLLDPAAIDPGFGMRVAIRTASPEAIQSLTRTELDHRSRTDRSSIPAGEALRGFGIGDFGEVITRVSGSANLPGLTTGSASIRIRAADALSVPLGKTPSALVHDLGAISSALDLLPIPELRALEQFVRIKQPDMLEQLNGSLRSALAGATDGRLALGWPHERVSDNGTPSAYRLSGTGARGSGPADDLPDLETVASALNAKTPGDPLAAASTIKIQLFRDSDGDEPVSGAIPALNWLFYEQMVDGIRYCLFDSRWYAMDSDYAGRLQDHVDEIFARPPRVALPDWDVEAQTDEAAYNEAAATAIGGQMLDRRLIRTTQHPRGFEACDIITPAADLVHVKHTPRSSAASHLVAQAVVSAEALRHDNEARQGLRDVVSDQGGDPAWLPDRFESIVLGMARETPITSTDLFSFTQVTLARLDASLAEAGIALTVAPVLRQRSV